MVRHKIPILISVEKNIEIEIDECDKNYCEIYVNNRLKEYPEKIEGTPLTSDEKREFAHNEKRNFYKNFLSNHFENLVILSGAGTSIACGGKTMAGLWEEVENKLTSKELEILCKAIQHIPETSDFKTLDDSYKDLEKLLSRSNIAKEFVKKYHDKTIDISKTVKDIEEIILKTCKSNKLKDNSPHKIFLDKITNRKLKDPRVKIFTLNYDTLFEQAAIKGNFTVIDGFSFGSPRTFSGRNFDHDVVYREKSRITEEESFVPKVFHLYKPHGSVNWELSSSNTVQINDNTKKPLMIYPKNSKYENSYEQPFFEMMARFQQNLRKDNVLLICIGFSFGDKHLLTAIQEAVSQNPSFRILIINKDICPTENTDWFCKIALSQANIFIVQEDFSDFTYHYPTSKIYTDENSTNGSTFST